MSTQSPASAASDGRSLEQRAWPLSSSSAPSGSVILLLYVLLWAVALTLGAGLIIHPGLGTGVQAGNGPTPTDFVTALYGGGSSMAIVGASEFRPTTDIYRLVYLVNSLIGMSVTSLVLTYVMQIYGALRQRNALGLPFHIRSAETSDAGELLVRLGPRGQFGAGYSHLVSLGNPMAEMKEIHHFYPVLFYFRSKVTYYSVSAQAHLPLDTVSLNRGRRKGERRIPRPTVEARRTNAAPIKSAMPD